MRVYYKNICGPVTDTVEVEINPAGEDLQEVNHLLDRLNHCLRAVSIEEGGRQMFKEQTGGGDAVFWRVDARCGHPGLCMLGSCVQAELKRLVGAPSYQMLEFDGAVGPAKISPQAQKVRA